MVDVVIWSRVLRLQGSPYTLLEYAREFNSDMLTDMQEVYKRGTFGTEFLQFAWAMNKTADPSVSHYEKWLKEFSPEAFNLEDAPWEVIDSALNAEMFCKKQTSCLKRLRLCFARFLERMARCLSTS